MRAILGAALALFALVPAAACTAADDIPAPHISGVAPNPVTAGGTVQIDGNAFCAQPEPEPGEEDPLACDHVGAVMFDAMPTTAALYTDTQIMVEVPTLPGETHVAVSVAGRQSNWVDLTIE